MASKTPDNDQPRGVNVDKMLRRSLAAAVSLQSAAGRSAAEANVSLDRIAALVADLESRSLGGVGNDQ